jgi:hypothetical protein
MLMPLRDSLMIYKEFNTWIAEYVGGQDIFSFRQVFSQIGMLTENCAITFGSNQLVLTDNDLVLHDGNSAQSIADKRTRRSCSIASTRVDSSAASCCCGSPQP